MKFVIARFNEDISWANDLDKVIIQKGVDMPNIGREPASYLWFIIHNYEMLSGEYVFCQGNPFDHDKNFVENIQKTNYIGDIHVSNYLGEPSDRGFNIDEILTELGLPTRGGYKFRAGCQFKVSAEEIKKHPYELYVKMLYLEMQGRNPWAFERIMPVIFPILN
jgi:hypothetical protein